MRSACSARWARRRWRSRRVSEVQTVPKKMRVALVEAVMGSKSLSNLEMEISWASYTQRRRSAVAPTTLARSPPEKNLREALPRMYSKPLEDFQESWEALQASRERLTRSML